MKKIKLTLIITLLASIFFSASSYAQDKQKEHITASDSIIQENKVDNLIAQTASTLLNQDGAVIDTATYKLPSLYAWTIDDRYGDRTLIPLDTLLNNYAQSTLPSAVGLGVNHLGNLGSAIGYKDFFEQPETSAFPFMDAYAPWRMSPSKNLFYNTKIPYSRIDYQTAGGKQVAESRLIATLTSNFGEKINVGFNIDYIHARGFYQSLSNKQISYEVFGSYIGERLKVQLYGNNNNLNSITNGGIINDKYITNPESEDIVSSRGGSKDIPVVFTDGITNKLRGRHLYGNAVYDLGQFYEVIDTSDSTSVREKKLNYVAPASVIFTTHYQDQRRNLISPSNSTDSIDKVFTPNIISATGGSQMQYGKYQGGFDDYMSHYTFTNTLALRLNEGFKDWVKFGLTFFAEAEIRKFLIEDFNNHYINKKHSDNIYRIGGRLSKTKGQNFRYSIDAQKALNTSEFSLAANISTAFKIKDKATSVHAKAYIKNITPKFFQENLSTRNWQFEKDFSDVKRVFVGGEIVLPQFMHSATKISGGYENISDYIYLGEVKIPTAEFTALNQPTWNPFRVEQMQSSKNVSVFSLKADQQFNFGIFHLNLTGLFQKSTEQDIIPLPTWMFSANAYLESKISKVLTFQLGAETLIHESYYVKAYNPVWNQYYNQSEENGVKIGNFPFTNVYLNLHLKYTRFFIMAYNVTEKLGNRQSFKTPHYPIDPFGIRWGLSWRFNN